MIGTPAQPALVAQTDQVPRNSRLGAALDAATRENARLQRELALSGAENRRLREQLRRLPEYRARRERIRMLSEPWSRNP